MRVVAAMSGGVDSAVAAARMVDAGHEVVGVHLALSQNAATLRESARGCCTIEDAGDARRVADVLGIPFYVWDLAARFARRSSRTSSRSTPPAARRTPASAATSGSSSPRSWTRRSRSASTRWQPVTTPRSSSGPTAARELHRAVDPQKDQSYVLGVLDEDQLSRSFFPLGDTTKPQIREEAEARGFYVASKPDSHDICFIPDGDTRGFLSRALGEQPGDLVDTEGKVVGSHAGAYGFTVGQRRGLGLDRGGLDGEPRFVVGVEARTNTVVIGTRDLLGVDAISAATPGGAGLRPTASAGSVPSCGPTVRSTRRPPGRTATRCTSGSRSGRAGSRPGSRWSSTRVPG